MIGPYAFPEGIAQLDADVRAVSPKCPACGRPDGGVVPNGQTPFEAGLVDRARCPDPECPMRDADATRSHVIQQGLRQ